MLWRSREKNQKLIFKRIHWKPYHLLLWFIIPRFPFNKRLKGACAKPERARKLGESDPPCPCMKFPEISKGRVELGAPGAAFRVFPPYNIFRLFLSSKNIILTAIKIIESHNNPFPSQKYPLCRTIAKNNQYSSFLDIIYRLNIAVELIT